VLNDTARAQLEKEIDRQQRDIQFTTGPMDDLENASSLPAYGSKMGIDATRKWPGEGFTREWQTRLKTSEAASRRAEELLKAIAKGT